MKIKGKRLLKNGVVAGYVKKNNGQWKWSFLKHHKGGANMPPIPNWMYNNNNPFSESGITSSNKFDLIKYLIGKRILEVGSGTGEISYNIISFLMKNDIYFKKYTVTEYSPDFLKEEFMIDSENVSYYSEVNARTINNKPYIYKYDVVLSFYPWFYGIAKLNNPQNRREYSKYNFDNKMLNSLYPKLSTNGYVLIFGATILPYIYCCYVNGLITKETNNGYKYTVSSNLHNRKNCKTKMPKHLECGICECAKYSLSPRLHNPWLLFNKDNPLSPYRNIRGYDLKILVVKPTDIDFQHLFKTSTSKPNTTQKSKIAMFNTVFIFKKLSDINEPCSIDIVYL